MTTAIFNVSIVLDRLELTDDTLDRVFHALPDAVPANVGGVVTLSAPVSDSSAEAAAFQFIDTVARVLPEAVIVRLDQDLVSISDIAERTERIRESIRLLVDGKRGPGQFPAPVGCVGDGIRVWPWESVLHWFKERLGDDLGERGVPMEVAAVVDACLAARKTQLANHARVTWKPGDAPMRSGQSGVLPPAYAFRSVVEPLIA